MAASKGFPFYLERNVQDHDAEIRFEVSGAKEGLTALKVLAPASVP